MAGVSFKLQLQQVREDAIVASANRLLAETGYDAMTVDEVAMQVQLAGEMPSSAAPHSTLRAALMANKTYIDRLIQVSDTLGAWITAAQKSGQLNRKCPPRSFSTPCSRAPVIPCSVC